MRPYCPSRLRVAVLALCAVAMLPALAQDKGEARFVTTTLSVRGNVAVPLSLTVGDLARFPVQRVDDTRVVRAQGSDSALVRQFAGCLLRDVLNTAKLTESGRNDLRRTIVVATASDGYKAVFSWAELFNTSIGDGVLSSTSGTARRSATTKGALRWFRSRTRDRDRVTSNGWRRSMSFA